MFICHKKERALWVRVLWLGQPTEGNTKGTHNGLIAHFYFHEFNSNCQ